MHTTNNYHEQTYRRKKSLGLELADALDRQILACRHKRRAQPHGINAGTDQLHSESACMKASTKHRWLMGSALSTHSSDNDRSSVIMDDKMG